MSAREAQNIGLLLVPGFSLMTFSSAIEPLRQANRISRTVLYRWTLLSADGCPVSASSGTPVVVDAAPGKEPDLDMVFVCAGIEPHIALDGHTVGWLRRLSQHGKTIGALSTGTALLARAGLLEGYRCTIHWESLASFKEEFPHLDVTANLFEIDRNRITSAGATATLDLMLYLIALRCGQELSAAVSEQYIHRQIRLYDESQRMPLQQRLRISHPDLLSAIALMEANLEDPLSLDELAESVRLSKRQLERLCQRHLGTSLMRYYKYLRLRRAHLLLTQSNLPVLDIAVACGFGSMSHFAKGYRAQFGRLPREERIHLSGSGMQAENSAGHRVVRSSYIPA
jgi:transcriptional regulator GlxA family with amidase domain